MLVNFYYNDYVLTISTLIILNSPQHIILGRKDSGGQSRMCSGCPPYSGCLGLLWEVL